MDTIQKINDLLVSLYNTVLKMEEKALRISTNHNLSITEIHTLVAIGAGKPKTMTQVANVLKINVSTLSVAVNKLVAKGFVKRFRVPEDRRIVKIELTEAGAAAVEEHEAFHFAMVKDAMSVLSPDEMNRFVESIDNLNEFMLMRRVATVKHAGAVCLKPIQLGELEIPVPLFQGGMGVGISMHGLASAAAACGGVGVISAAQIGFGEPDYETNPLEANLRVLKSEIRLAREAVKELPGAGPVGVNIMASSRHYEEYVRASIEAGAQLILSGAGLPTSLPAICKGSGVKLIPIVSSLRALGILLRNWAKKYNRLPDAVIFEGPMAGGHLGFKEELLETAKADFYKNIAEIKAELSDSADCPLIASGGIYNWKDAEKALACGADGVQLGTRFVTTKECDAPDAYKQAYISAAERDILIIRSPIGMPARVLKNDFTKKVEAGEKIPITGCSSCLSACDPAEAPFCVTQAMIAAARGDMENGLIFCGSKVGRARKLESVAGIFREFTEGR